MRIICLVPSITELLYELKLVDEVIGITKFCIYPEHWLTQKVIVGGTKNINVDKINSLQPDWVIVSKEENIKEQVEAIDNSINILVTNVVNIEDALNMIRWIGKIFNREQEAADLLSQINISISKIVKSLIPKRVLYLIWKDPYMSVGQDTYIHHIIEELGYDNVCNGYERYPSITIEKMITMNIDEIWLSSEPYPFKEKHIEELQLLFNNNIKIKLVDGTMFSWYGSRLKFIHTISNFL